MIQYTCTWAFFIGWGIISSVFAQGNDSIIQEAIQAIETARIQRDNQALILANRKLGKVYFDRAQFTEAMEPYLAASVLTDSANDPYTWAEVRIDLGNTHLAMGNFPQALSDFMAAKPVMESEGSINDLGRNLYRIGDVYSKQGHLKLALESFEQANEVLLAEPEIDSVMLSSVLIATGIVYSRQSDYPKALEYYKKAEAIYIALDNQQYLQYVYNNMSGAHLSRGDYPRAIEYLQRVLRIAEKFNHKLLIMTAEANMGTAYIMQKGFDKALPHLERAKTLAEEMGNRDQVARVTKNMGSAYEALGDTVKAMQAYASSLDVRKAIGDRTGTSSSHQAMGNLLLEKGDLAQAEEHLRDAQKISEEVGDPKGHSQNLAILGKLFNRKKQFRQAEKYCRKGLALVEELGLLEQMRDNCECLVQAYEGLGDYRQLVKYQQQFMEVRDSLLNEEKIQELTRLEMQYDFDKEKELLALEQKQKEDQLNSDIERQSLLRNFLIGGLMLGGMIILILWRAYNINQQKNHTLARQKNTIQRALDDKETLLKEIHHRVKNNLQVVASLLSLQSRTIEDPKALDAIEEGRNRVKAMALIHQNLYQEENLIGVNLSEYIEKLTENLVYSYKVNTEQVHIKRDVAPITLDVDILIPLGLILNELISNSLKYAFPDRNEGEIEVKIAEQEAGLQIQISDNGIGLPQGFEPGKTKSMGFKLVQSFVRKMNAQFEVLSQNGTHIHILLPKAA